MGLSRKGWNNVLIFACMGMIILFNLMNDKLVANAEGEVVSILPEQSMILTLEYPQFSIERLGTSWRITPNESLEQDNVAPLIEAWLKLSGEVSVATSEEEGFRVTLWLAGKEHPTKLWIQPQSQLVTDIISQDVWKITPHQLSTINKAVENNA
ncbi:hypothetical protein ACMAZF_00460 [Psychrobium sp. nBUS_13]|uniref:hypothetical protein n=1 Tax=Psychrobium sp. nBUS_13 TaxID=3395319 RepID=UPI003EB7B502